MTLRAAIGKVVRTDDRGGCVAERDGVDNKAWDKKKRREGEEEGMEGGKGGGIYGGGRERWMREGDE